MADPSAPNAFLLRIATVAFCLSCAKTAPALDSAFPDLSAGSGFDIGVGAAYSTHDHAAGVAEAHATLVFVNASVEVGRNHEDDFASAYLGLGLGPAVQLQRGMGDVKSTRLRSVIVWNTLMRGDLDDMFFFPTDAPRQGFLLSPYIEAYDDDLHPADWRFGLNVGWLVR